MRRTATYTWLALVVLCASCVGSSLFGQAQGVRFVPGRIAGDNLKAETPLEDGVERRLSWRDIPDLPPDTIAVDTTNQYTMEVTETLESLVIVMAAADVTKNFELFVRYNAPIELTGGQIVADYFLMSPQGFEELGVWRPNLPETLPGKYYIAFGTQSKLGGPFTIMADVDGALKTLTSGVPVQIAAGVPGVDPVGTDFVYGDGHQYRLDPPRCDEPLRQAPDEPRHERRAARPALQRAQCLRGRRSSLSERHRVIVCRRLPGGLLHRPRCRRRIRPVLLGPRRLERDHPRRADRDGRRLRAAASDRRGSRRCRPGAGRRRRQHARRPAIRHRRCPIRPRS